MNEKFTPMFGKGSKKLDKTNDSFSKKGEEINVESPEQRFAQFLKETKSSGDTELDNLRTDYIALQAFRQVDNAGLSDSMEEEKLKKEMMKKLRDRR